MKRLSRLLTALAVAAAISVASAATAFAAPVDEHLGLTGLQQMIDDAAGAPVDGYLRTVLRGSTIETIGVDILAITSDSLGASNGSKALIIFESDDPKIVALGGIASGMSGSPIYVNDGGTYKVVGALSYGDWFSKNGWGLATPIEAMLAVAGYPTDSAFTISSLSAPVPTSEGLIKDIVVTDDAKIAAAARNDHTLVAKPYSALSIGGLPPSSRGYQKLAASAAARGFDVQPLGSALGTSKGSWSTPFVPGAGAAAMVSWGDFWVGGIGTATYVDSDTVLAFGHPMDWDGASHWALANAWIDYTAPSINTPWKIGQPGMVRGRITQDRGAAILGRTDLRSEVTTITSRVIDTSLGQEITGTSYMPRVYATGDWSYLPAEAAYATALRSCDDYWYKGSAHTTTTVVVSDDSGTYTVVRSNIWDSTWDVAYEMIWDPMIMVDYFYGTDAEVLSVDFQATLDPDNVDARIVDVETPNGLKSGVANTVRVSLLESGNPTTQTVDMTLNIPAGVPNTGRIYVSGGPYGSWDDDEDYYLDEMDSILSGSRVRRYATTSASDIVDGLNERLLNSDLSATYYPVDMAKYKSFKAIETTAATPWYLEGATSKSTAFFDLYVDPKVADYNSEIAFGGEVDGIINPSTLSIFGRPVDSPTTSLLATFTIDPDEDEEFAEFEEYLSGLRKNTIVSIRFDGDEYTLRTQAYKTAKVRAAIKVTSNDYSVRYGKKVLLTAKIAPSATKGKVVFQRYLAGRWRTIATKTISAGGARVYFKPAKGKNKVRVKYLGGPVNEAKTSYTKTITAK